MKGEEEKEVEGNAEREAEGGGGRWREVEGHGGIGGAILTPTR